MIDYNTSGLKRSPFGADRTSQSNNPFDRYPWWGVCDGSGDPASVHGTTAPTPVSSHYHGSYQVAAGLTSSERRFKKGLHYEVSLTCLGQTPTIERCEQ